MITFRNLVDPWIRFTELKVVASESCTFIKKTDDPESPLIPMIKLPIQVWVSLRHFNCLNLQTGDLDFCYSSDFVLPIDVNMQVNASMRVNGLREETK